MVDPSIASVAVTTAVKAIAPVAVRASAPTWRAICQSSVFEPKKLRALPEWPALKESRNREKTIRKFLKTRLCTGLLESFAIRCAGNGEDSASNNQIEETFKSEFARRVGDDYNGADEVADVLWTELTNTIRFSIKEMRTHGELSANDMLLLADLNRVQPSGTTVMESAVVSRHRITRDVSRSAHAERLVTEIRSASLPLFSEMSMPHARESHRVELNKLYVPRSLTEWRDGPLSELGSETDESEIPLTVSEEEVHDRRFVVVGSPGAGKSTYMRKRLHSVCLDQEEGLAPLILELKSWSSNSGSIASMIARRVSSTLQIDADEASISDILTLGMGFVVLDGLDEIVDLTEKRNLTQAIESFAHRYPIATIIVTSRREGYSTAPLTRRLFPVYEIPDYSDDQMRLYAQRWFDVVSDLDGVDATTIRERFLSESVHAAELRKNPLMLSLLCLLYKYEGYIPENRTQVYEECSELLFGRWDRIRGIATPVKGNSKSHHLVEEIADYFFRRQGSQSGETERFLHAVIKEFLQSNVVEDEFEASEYAQEFLDYCAGRAWLLSKVGTSLKGERLFGFTHRTFMEFFAACRLARFAADAQTLAEDIRRLLDVNASEVICQIAIDRFDERNARGADEVIRWLVFGSPTIERNYNQRDFAFALRALEFIEPSPRLLRSIANVVLWELSEKDGDEAELFRFPLKLRKLVHEEAETAISVEPKNKREYSIRAGARVFLARDVAMKSQSIAWLRDNALGILTGKMLRGSIELAEYREAVGNGCLTRSGPNDSGEFTIPGPLVHALDEANRSGYVDEVLAAMLDMAKSDPKSIVPMNNYDLANLADELESIPEWKRHHVFGACSPVEQQPVKGFTTICAAVAFEGFRNQSHEAITTGLKCGFDLEYDFEYEQEEASWLIETFRSSGFVEFNSDWLDYLSSVDK